MNPPLSSTETLYTATNPESLIGKSVGQSPWFRIDQERINAFARDTNDWDRMHVDPEWCRQHSPFGKPIVFGFQTLAMLTYLLNEAVPRPSDEAYALNYGFDRLRLTSPIVVGSEIRALFTLKKVTRKDPNTVVNTLATTVEVKGSAKPALVGDWLVLMSRH
ncbi:MAG: MaoC family dehydratase [Casimicrobium sp.]